MDQRPKTLRELLADGSLDLRSRAEVEGNAAGDDAATVRWMEETRAEALAGPRKPGRPPLGSRRQETRVRSVRLPVHAWSEIDRHAEEAGTSANRFIEEAVLARLAGQRSRAVQPRASGEWTTLASSALPC